MKYKTTEANENNHNNINADKSIFKNRRNCCIHQAPKIEPRPQANKRKPEPEQAPVTRQQQDHKPQQKETWDQSSKDNTVITYISSYPTGLME